MLRGLIGRFLGRQPADRRLPAHGELLADPALRQAIGGALGRGLARVRQTLDGPSRPA